MSYDENKQIILEIIYSMDTMINLRSEEFQYFFNSIYENTYNNNTEFNNVTDMNKHIINNCYQYINSETMKLKQSTEPSELSRGEMIETIDINDIKHIKDDKFTMKLKNKQDEFNSLIKKAEPSSINFADKDEEDTQNLDVLMNQSLADREKQLEFITQKYGEKKTQKFLTSEDTRSDHKKEKVKNEGKKVSFEINEPNNDAFNDVNNDAFNDANNDAFNDVNNGANNDAYNDANNGANNNVMNFLSKLKPKQSSTDKVEIVDMLKTIITNQDKILRYLHLQDESIDK